MQFHEEQEPYGDIGGYSEEFEEQVQRPVKSSRFRSIPLRTHQQPKAGAIQATTTRSHRAIPDVQAQPKRPVQKQQSYVSRQQMPAIPDEEELYQKPSSRSARREDQQVVRATPTSIARYTDNQGRDVYEQNNRRIIHKSKPPRRFLNGQTIVFLNNGKKFVPQS